MAKHTVLHETDNFIKNCINRAGIAQFDIDGAGVVVVGGRVQGDHEIHQLAQFAEGDTQVAIAYNPAVKYDVINGKKFPAKSADDRDYFNPKGDVVDFFIPEKNIEFGIVGIQASVGDKLQPSKTAPVLEVVVSPVATAPLFEVVDTMKVKYPTFDFTEEKVDVVVLKTVRN